MSKWRLILKYSLKGIKGFWGWTKRYRMYLLIGLLAAALLYVLHYVSDHASMKITIESQKTEISRLQERDGRLVEIIAQRNAQIERMNERQRLKLVEMQERLATARAEVIEAKITRDQIAEELAMTRFRTLEAMQDDEDFADWISEPVPATGWSMLQQAEEGNPR